MIPIRYRPARAAALLCCAAFLTACKDNAGPPEGRVTTVEAASGDLQGGAVATQLIQPVVAKALDAQGKPVSGATVAWQAAGGGSVTPTAMKTDDNGRAGANWTLGPTAGDQAATLTIGTATVTFHATAVAGPAASITVTPTPLLLDAIGAQAVLQFVAKDAHDNVISGRVPAWTSTNSNIVAVDASGNVLAVSPGSATVRATMDGATGDAQVTVQPAAASITVDPGTVQFTSANATQQFQASAKDRNGNPVTVPAGSFVWSSSNTAVVDVSSTGLATAKGNGTAQVRATIGTVTGQAQVTVAQVAVSLTVSPAVDTLTSAAPTAQLTATGVDANGQPITAPAVVWSTANGGVAVVAPNGIVSAVANGSVYVRATSGAVTDSALIVVRLNAAPVAVADTIAATKNTPLVVPAPGLLANDTLGVPSGTIVSFGGGSLLGTATANVVGTTVAFGTGGSIRVNADGSLTFTPSNNFQGAFTFQYRLQNATGSSDATVTINVGVAPSTVDDAYMVGAGMTLTVNAATGVLANDDPGFPLGTVISFGGADLGGAATSYTAGGSVAFGVGGFNGGLLTVMADGSFSFTPPAGFTGTFTFQYRLASQLGHSDGTVIITIS